MARCASGEPCAWRVPTPSFASPPLASSPPAFCAAGLDAIAKRAASPLEALGAALAPRAVTLPAHCLAARYSSYLAPLRDSNFTTGTPTNRQW